jgi:predicted transcriptional regulator
MIALLSIKPEYADKIFTGEKRFEYRKAIFKRRVSKIVVYSTKPVGMIIGEFLVEDILEDDPKELWLRTKESSGVCEEFYYEYFKGRSKGYAIKVGKISLYDKPYDPNIICDPFTAPQSFRYLDQPIIEDKNTPTSPKQLASDFTPRLPTH